MSLGVIYVEYICLYIIADFIPRINIYFTNQTLYKLRIVGYLIDK